LVVNSLGRIRDKIIFLDKEKVGNIRWRCNVD